MITYQKFDLLFNKPIQLSEKVYINTPTVEQVCYEEDFTTYSSSVIRSTREMFTPYREDLEKLSAKYPTIWGMIFDDEGDIIFGKINGFESGRELVIETLSYWTSLPKEDFEILVNSKKIINKKADWIIDEDTFNGIVELIKDLINYKENTDLIAPLNMSKRQEGIFYNMYKGRVRKLKKQTGRTMADKILILQISMDSYIPMEEIRKMSIYHFNKLYESIELKEAYNTQLQYKLSPKFDVKDEGGQKHWKENVRM